MPKYVGKSPSENGPAVQEIGVLAVGDDEQGGPLAVTGDVGTQARAGAAAPDKYGKVVFVAKLKVTQYRRFIAGVSGEAYLLHVSFGISHHYQS